MPDQLQLAVVIPTFNERDNVAILLARLAKSLVGIRWELIFVDDHSPDGTADVARAAALSDSRIRVIQRIGRRGLSSACIEGMCATPAPIVAVMDGDLQHDDALLPLMFAALDQDQHLDLVVGSRFIEGGGTGDWSDDRVAKSAFASKLSRLVVRSELTDPMSGFFMIRTGVARSIIPDLSAVGFKILLDLVVASRGRLAILELPYVFKSRIRGDSKLDYVVAIEFLIALYNPLLGQVIPVRFLMFSMIGVLGLGVHMAVLAVLYVLLGTNFVPAVVAATVVAMTSNFLINNALTYRDQRLRGSKAVLLGWLSFAAVCGVGAVANVGIAAFLHEARGGQWTTAALAGVVVSAVWNYALSSKFVWGRY